MSQRLMAVELERDMRLTLAATEHLLIETVSYRGITALPSDQVRSPFYGRFRLGLTLVVVFAIQGGTERALHRRRSSRQL